MSGHGEEARAQQGPQGTQGTVWWGLRTGSRVTDTCSHHVLTLTCTLHVGKNVQEEPMFKKKKMRSHVMECGPHSKCKEESQRQTVCVCNSRLDPKEQWYRLVSVQGTRAESLSFRWGLELARRCTFGAVFCECCF